MAKEICISTTPHETRLAILEDDQLAEIYYERENEYTLAGSIYKGRVTRVLPGMQSSFVDVGLERDAFLYVTDFLEEQEDSEEYASEGNGGRREGRPRADQGEEQQALERAERSPERDRGAERERSGDRGRRGAAPNQPESREGGGRAGRERAREQAAAPLREAVPAAQDLEEKGDEESPTGTRRWRGRRGRRRGVRGNLAGAAAQPLLSDSPENLEEAGTGEFEAAAPFSIAEHGAPGGIADLHASPARDEEETQPGSLESGSRREAGRQSGREPGREGSRDRGVRRPREPYAQASTFDRSDRPANQFSASPQQTPGSPATTIVLPGESLSKYGSAPADAGTPPPASSPVPRAPARPVNYVAPKPSTLVEVSSDWDGGSVLPGETLSRYREAEPTPAPGTGLSAQGPTHEQEPQPEAAGSMQPVPAEAGLDQIEAPVEHLEHLEHLGQPEQHAVESEHGTPDTQEAYESAHTAEAAPAHAEPEPAPLAEPELVAEAVGSAPEPEPAHVAEPHIENPADPAAAEAAEYDPEEASASYRVSPSRASELRIASPEAEPLPYEYEQSTHADEERSAHESLAEPAGAFVGAPGLSGDGEAAEPRSQGPAPVGELAGALADAPASHAAEPQGAHGLSILHEDGSIESVPIQPFGEVRASEVMGDVSVTEEVREEHAPGFPAITEEEALQGAPPASDFSRLVDQMQGFAPGNGLLEEEVMDEEEYDFDPIHAHSDEHDQEDLEEETLDHHAQQIEPSTLSDAVRDSYLEQRVHGTPGVAGLAAGEIEEAEPADARFGFEEVDEDEEEDEEETAETDEAEPGAHAGEPQRNGRGDDSRGGRGRTGGRGAGRNGGNRRGGPGRSRSAQTQDLPIISDLLKQGQEILVQIAKEPIAKKGARITSHIALPGRFLVFMPTVSHVGVSRKIASDEERLRLKRILISEKGDSSGGFIVRTAAEGASEEDLRADLRFLISLWTEIKQRSESAKAPALIYHDLNLIERILRDQVSSNFSTIWVDSEAEYERIIRFLNRFQPQLVRRVKLYTKETPLFEHFGIQEEISKALKSKVWLKSGGSIVINQTEALVAIDINTGKYVGKTARLEDTIVKTNLDAITEIVRQIRLRDLGGIIVIDFIDMDERKNRHRVLAALEEELKHDRAPSKVLQFNDFGLVAITRKRVKQSLERTLSVQCEVCTGTGMVKSPVTVCNEIYIEMRKMLKHLDGKDVMLRVHPEVVKQLKAANGKWINELEEMVAKTIIIKSDPALHPEQFDIH